MKKFMSCFGALCALLLPLWCTSSFSSSEREELSEIIAELKDLNEEQQTIIEELKNLSKEQKKSSVKMWINLALSVIVSFLGGFLIGRL